MKRKGALIYILFLFAILSQTVVAQVQFTARLTGSQEVPSQSSTASGTAAFTLTDEGLTYIIAVDSISKITEAHFHYGAMGDTGKALISIQENFRGNIAYGTWKTNDTIPLTEDLKNALLTGKIYVNIHTEDHPNGEIRGQVLATSGTSFSTILSGDQEVPAVVSVGSGTGTFLLTDAGLAYSITLNGLSDPTEAHFHLGELGVSGDVIKPLSISSNKIVGIWAKTDAEPLTDRWINALLADSIYVNVHTKNHPEGEIRGQIHLEGGIGFYANFTGAQEVPPVNSTAKATGYFVLTQKGLVFNISVNSKDSIIAAQFNRAPAGMIGGVVRIINELKGSQASGIWRFDDTSEPFSDDVLAELMKGNIYINLITEKNLSGEIRGQLTMINGTLLTANLSPFQVHTATPKNTTGRGTASFYFTDEGLAFNITLAKTDTLKSAHLHLGKIGKNGDIVKSIKEFVRYTANGVWKYSDSLQALTPDLISRLFKGEIYLNIRTKADTLGGLRGQLLLANGTNFRANLTGAQEKVKTNAKGTGSFTLTNEGLVYKITADSIVISGAHFHMGEPGVPGNVVKDIITDFVGNTATGIWKTSGNQPLTPELIKALMTGKLYFSVHSPARPLGEIRGQIVLNGGWGFSAHMNGFQQVPQITTNARGNASMTLTPAGLVLDATLTGLEPTGFGIYRGLAGQNGSLVHNVASDFQSRTISDVWLTNSADSLDFDNIAALLTEELYLNASTSQNPNGEIRGQIVKLVKDAVSSTGSKPNMPERFSLEQNYPNPFNPATSIRFTLPAAGMVNLTIYNMLGQRVSTLINQQMNAGSHEVKFDASMLPSGIYLYRLSAGENVSVKKMMLLK